MYFLISTHRYNMPKLKLKRNKITIYFLFLLLLFTVHSFVYYVVETDALIFIFAVMACTAFCLFVVAGAGFI